MPAYLTKVLEEIATVYPPGVLKIGEGSAQLRGCPDVSLSFAELYCVRLLIERLKFKTCFTVGNAFGLSATYMAMVMAANGGQRMLTIDPASGQFGLKQHRVATQLVARLNLPIPLIHTIGYSPIDLPMVCCDDVYDLIVIDADHAAKAVYYDFSGLYLHSSPDTLWVFHDVAMYGPTVNVAAGVMQIFQDYHIPLDNLFVPPTVKNIGFASFNDATLETCREVLKDPLSTAEARQFSDDLKLI